MCHGASIYEIVNTLYRTGKQRASFNTFYNVNFSANVLLDGENVAKLGDFGLAKMGPKLNDPEVTSLLTTTVIGTSAYMPPEAYDGKVSVKQDTYSYGVVCLI